MRKYLPMTMEQHTFFIMESILCKTREGAGPYGVDYWYIYFFAEGRCYSLALTQKSPSYLCQ